MKVKVKMDTRQRVDREEELISHEARGILRKEGKDYLITYLLDGIHHEMRLDTEIFQLTVVRNWQEKNGLCYRRGLKHAVQYDTPMGAMDLCFHTKQLLAAVSDREEGRILVELSYAVYQFDSLVMECELRIEISPLK